MLPYLISLCNVAHVSGSLQTINLLKLRLYARVSIFLAGIFRNVIIQVLHNCFNAMYLLILLQHFIGDTCTSAGLIKVTHIITTTKPDEACS